MESAVSWSCVSVTLQLFCLIIRFRCLNLLLLLFCLVYQSETPPVGSHSVTRKKADSFTLSCKVEDNEIIYLIRQSKIILVCQNEECENKTENVQGVCKKGACDVTIKNLSFSDAGKYILRFNYKNDPKEKEQRKEKTYRLHIHDEVSVKIGEQLKLDVLSNADKVQHQNETSAERTEIWSRSDRVQSDRLTDSDGTLTINNFTASDAGTYSVLDTEGEILITVTVTESRRESKGKLDDTEQHTVENWIVPVVVCLVILVALVGIMISVIIWRRRHRGYEQGRVQENPEPPQEPEEL
ncbi:uncharacterized protein LOC107714286 [Sinocyclocheilus rhinocerous]|uniref:uncharacterized protein LOC107714286 n=1 Tax=Sinocyclocheilus rhinocerous TaxID=307959 RepID=UPI0007B9B280|nr:PREDICTED: uncharacterized protein LOC107714286 [Sinocyclocheilus rhinocerous]